MRPIWPIFRWEKSQPSFAMVGLRFQASNLDPRWYLACRARGGTVGVVTTRIDDFSVRGERGALDLVRRYSERRFGAFKAEDADFVHVGTELSEERNFPIAMTHQGFPDAIHPVPATPGPWATRTKW